MLTIIFLFLALVSSLLFLGRLAAYAKGDIRSTPDTVGCILLGTTVAFWIGFYIFSKYTIN